MLRSVFALLVSLAYGHPVPEANSNHIPTAPCFPWSNAALDGGVAAPLNHIVMLENQWTRVVEVINPGGEKENYHTHARPSLFMMDRPSSVQHWYGDGSANPAEANVPDDLYYKPMTAESGNVYFMSPNDFHSVKNTDNKLFHSVRMELKGYNASDPASFGYLSCPNIVCSPPSSPVAGARSLSPYQTAARASIALAARASIAANHSVRMVLENEAARVWDVFVAPGQITEKFQLTADLSVVVVDKLAGYRWFRHDTAGYRTHRWSPAPISTNDVYYAPATVASNKVFLLTDSAAQPWSIQNTGTKDFHAIIVELVQSTKNAAR